MKLFLIGLFTLALAVPAAAQVTRVQGVEVIDAGIYAPVIKSTHRDSKGVLQSVIGNPRLVTRTTTIPAKLGVSFGFRYRIVGAPVGAHVALTKVTRYPAPGGRPAGSTQPLLASSRPLIRQLNVYSYSAYSIEEPWEVLPGKWVFEFWFADRMIGSQEFTLVAQ
jgi:hypothetical protein